MLCLFGLAGALMLMGGLWLDARADGAAEATVVTAPDHYKCYGATPQKVGRKAVLSDRFERKRTLVVQAIRLCTPAQKNAEGMRQPEGHLACYSIRDAGRQPALRPQTFVVRNQFGSQTLTVRRAQSLCLASLKSVGSTPPVGPSPTTLLDHVKCYQVTAGAGFSPFFVLLTDQFGQARARVIRPETFCGPVQVDRERPRQDDTGLVCYTIADEGAAAPAVTISNRLGTKPLTLGRGQALCVPSRAAALVKPGSIGCNGLSIPHGGAGVIGLTGTVLSSTLRSFPVNAERRLVALGGHRWKYISTKVDGPERVVRDFVDVFAAYQTSRGARLTTVTCVVTVKHSAGKGPPPPPPPTPVVCLVIPRFKLDPAQVPKTGFANFGASVSFANIATISRWWLRETTTWNRPKADIFAPSHGWTELVNDPIPSGGDRFERDFFVNTYWTNGNIESTPLKPTWVFVIEYKQRARTKCSAKVEFVFLQP